MALDNYFINFILVVHLGVEANETLISWKTSFE